MKPKLKAEVIQLKPARRQSHSLRPYMALHLAQGTVVRRTFAASLPSAIKFSVEHLWRDSYGATSVRVFDRHREQLVASLKKLNGKITALPE